MAFYRSIVSLALIAAVAGCTQQSALFQPPNAPPAGVDSKQSRPASANYQVLYNFTSAEGRVTSVAALDGLLYTTSAQYSQPLQSLLIFDATGRVRAFRRNENISMLFSLSGKMYALVPCAASNCTAIETLDDSGTLNLVRKVHASIGGYVLTVAGGKAYGTNHGTVYSLTPSGQYRVVYRFRGGVDGSVVSSLVPVGGKVYGTTFDGGSKGYGSFFVIDPAGQKQTLYEFKGGSDGLNPTALVPADGAFYGVTERGGTNTCQVASSGPSQLQTAGCGTMFEMSSSGNERVVYNFGTANAFPISLIETAGVLYGATSGEQVSAGAGTSTIFTITPSGVLKTLHAFGTQRDDAMWADLGPLPASGSLFGTALVGGKYGDGILFKLSP